MEIRDVYIHTLIEYYYKPGSTAAVVYLRLMVSCSQRLERHQNDTRFRASKCAECFSKLSYTNTDAASSESAAAANGGMYLLAKTAARFFPLCFCGACDPAMR